MSKLWLAAAGVLLPGLACAQPIDGLYVSGAAGGNALPPLQSSKGTTKIDTSLGPVGLAALGWGFGNGLRVELEGSYRSDNIGNISTLRVDGAKHALTNVNGNAATYAVMTNLEYDVPLQPFGVPVQPYVGAGVGYGWLDLGSANGNGSATFRLPDNNTFSGPDTVSFGTAGAFAYQAIVGAALPIQKTPGLQLTFEYRFFGVARADVPVTRATTTGDLVNGMLPSSHTHDGFEVHDSAVLIGLRYAFGAL
jgi:opacity protein-like surface antigen